MNIKILPKNEEWYVEKETRQEIYCLSCIEQGNINQMSVVSVIAMKQLYTTPPRSTTHMLEN